MMRFALPVLALLATPACAKAPANNQSEAPAADHSQDASWMNQQQAVIANLKAADGWQPLPGNGRWRRIKGDGKGAHPTVDDTVTLNYEGKLTDGSVFDSSYARNEPATFPLGQLVKGWQVAVPNMGVGDTIEIWIPSDLGYGPAGAGPIPGGASLYFKIALMAIQGK